LRISVESLPQTWDAQHDEAVIAATIEQSIWADRLGFDAVFLPEHHFHGYAPAGADPFQIGAHLAPQLTQAWLGMAVVVVPTHHPVRLVEQMNLLDHLAKGKVIFGIGSGATAQEGIGFGLNTRDQQTYVSAENLAIAEQLWDKTLDDPAITFETKYYRGIVLERIVPAPYRKRRPHLMAVGLRDESIERAARNGWPVFLPYSGDFQLLKKALHFYRQRLAAANHGPETLAHAMGWTTHTVQGIWVAETDAQAFADMIVALEAYQRFADRRYRFNRVAEEIGKPERRFVRPPAPTPEFYETYCLWGSPDTIAAHFQKFADIGVGNLLLCFNNTLYDADRKHVTEKSMRLFAEQVMPRLRRNVTPLDPLAIDLGVTAPADQAPALTG